MTQIPRILIAGTHSGCGKTTVASGIMAALTARGYVVQPFKVGPDFIDPSHHTKICGRPSRNLDPFMMGEDGVARTFCNATKGADIAVIEGVMGMFDGLDGSDFASTAHVAKIINAPVILVIDAKGMSGSVHALIKGFTGFDPAVSVAGVIFNRVGSPRHRTMIEAAIEVPVFGWVPRREDLALESRHLGLVMAHESGIMGQYGAIVEEFCDLDRIRAAAAGAKTVESSSDKQDNSGDPVKIGIALDETFCFYYEDNIDSLRHAGAEIIFFSPLTDLLPDVHALYLGGGYPELHLPALESSPCAKKIKQAANDGLPIYGECGGLLYLAREIDDGKTHRMCSILPASSEMTKRVQALGYVDGKTRGNNSSVFPRPMGIRGHEFHYSRVLPEHDARYEMILSRGKGIDAGKDWLVSGTTIGSYTHAYFSREFSKSFVDAARRYKNR
jgi:cobyrinic acid a,c-diamide synthase